jgi:superfamily II DNA helicase RecQ
MVEYGKSKPHHIMSYRTIKDLLEKKPRTINELYEVYGFGDYKVKNYGSRIIDIFNQ